MEKTIKKWLAGAAVLLAFGATAPVFADDAVKAALGEARATLRNIKAVDVVSTGLRGDNLDEWRAFVRDLRAG